MAKHVKKTDQDKAWNKRTATSKAYAMKSKEANVQRFLVICEGANTEPCYFEAFPVATAEVKTYGMGRSKTSLVEYVMELVGQEKHDPEREIWIVFDMDVDFNADASLQKEDFNQAVTLAERQGFKVAYSNDAFELWFVLHYQLIEQALTRIEYYKLISNHWNISYERIGKNERFCRDIYDRLEQDGKASQQNAIRHAERLFEAHAHLPPSSKNPCTTVFSLVNELNKYLKQ